MGRRMYWGVPEMLSSMTDNGHFQTWKFSMTQVSPRLKGSGRPFHLHRNIAILLYAGEFYTV